MENTNPQMPPPPQGNYQQPNYQQPPQGGYQQGGYQQQGGFGMQMDHPSASSVNTLGIMGLIFTFLFGIVGLILNIICLSKSGSALSDINANPGRYSEASIKKIKSGRTCSIIGLSIQGAAILILILVLAANS
jgi:hypothetical protein